MELITRRFKAGTGRCKELLEQMSMNNDGTISIFISNELTAKQVEEIMIVNNIQIYSLFLLKGLERCQGQDIDKIVKDTIEAMMTVTTEERKCYLYLHLDREIELKQYDKYRNLIVYNFTQEAIR